MVGVGVLELEAVDVGWDKEYASQVENARCRQCLG